MANSVKAAGIDISVWQDENSTPQMMDFTRARSARASFAFIKASQGTWLDPDFSLNWNHAQAAGMPRGAYHFLDWTAPAIDQARFFCGLLQKDPGELPPTLDFEARAGVPGATGAIAAARVFLEEVEQTLGKRPMIYTSPSYWAEFGSKDPWFAEFPLWIAHYYVILPTVPIPWKSWEFWQWGLGKGLGRLYGAESKDIDLDLFRGTEDELVAAYSLGGSPAPSPKPLVSSFPHRVVTPTLNVRKGPGTQYAVVGTLNRDQVVDVYAVSGQNAWVQIDPVQDLWACAMLDGKRYLLEVAA